MRNTTPPGCPAPLGADIMELLTSINVMQTDPRVDYRLGPHDDLSKDIAVPRALQMAIPRQMINEVDLISHRTPKWTLTRGLVAVTLLT